MARIFFIFCQIFAKNEEKPCPEIYGWVVHKVSVSDTEFGKINYLHYIYHIWKSFFSIIAWQIFWFWYCSFDNTKKASWASKLFQIKWFCQNNMFTTWFHYGWKDNENVRIWIEWEWSSSFQTRICFGNQRGSKHLF